MDTRVLEIHNVPTIVDIIMEDPILVEEKRRFYNWLELPIGEFGDIQREVRHGGSESYDFFSICLTKWITARGRVANLYDLIAKLDGQCFHSTADKISTCNLPISRGLEHLTNTGACIWFDIPEDVLNFTGRTAELKSLHESILQSNNGNRIVITTIRGLGGVGKTSLTIRYAWEYHQFFGNVVWINSENRSSSRDSFTRLAKELNIDTSSFNELDKFKDTLACVYKYFGNRRVLFIFDNVEAEDENLRQILPSSTSPYMKKPFVLLTSRNGEWSERYQVMWLDMFTLDESIEFMKSYLSLQSEVEFQLAKELSELLQRLPLAVRQAAAYIKTQQKYTPSIEQRMRLYTVQFGQNAKHFLSWKKTDDKFKVTTYSTWNITLKKIEKNPLALRIIQIISLLAPDNIGVEIFENLSPVKDNSWRKSLTFWNTGEPQILNSACLTEAVDLLLQYSLLVENKSGQLSVHRLLQTVIREQLTKSKLEKRLKDSMEILQGTSKVGAEMKMVSESLEEIIQIHCQSVLGHAKGVLLEQNPKLHEFTEFVKQKQEGYIQSELEKADNLFENGSVSESLEIYRALFESGIRYKMEGPTEFLIKLKMANTLKRVGNNAEALSFYDDILNVAYLYTEGPFSFSKQIILSNDNLEQLLQNRCYVLRLLGKPNSEPPLLVTAFAIINQANDASRAIEILGIMSCFPFVFMLKWLTNFWDEKVIESITTLLFKSKLVVSLGSMIYIDPIARSWFRLFSSYEMRKSSIEKSLLLNPPDPSSPSHLLDLEMSLLIWNQALNYEEVVIMYSGVGAEISKLEKRKDVLETLIQTLDILKEEFERKCGCIFDIMSEILRSPQDKYPTVFLSLLLREMVGNCNSSKLALNQEDFKKKLYAICVQFIDVLTHPLVEDKMRSTLAENLYSTLCFCVGIELQDMDSILEFNELSDGAEPEALLQIPLIILGRLEEVFDRIYTYALCPESYITYDKFYPLCYCLLRGASCRNHEVRTKIVRHILHLHDKLCGKTSGRWYFLSKRDDVVAMSFFCATFLRQDGSDTILSQDISRNVVSIIDSNPEGLKILDALFLQLGLPGFESTVEECLEFLGKERDKFLKTNG